MVPWARAFKSCIHTGKEHESETTPLRSMTKPWEIKGAGYEGLSTGHLEPSLPPLLLFPARRVWLIIPVTQHGVTSWNRLQHTNDGRLRVYIMQFVDLVLLVWDCHGNYMVEIKKNIASLWLLGEKNKQTIKADIFFYEYDPSGPSRQRRKWCLWQSWTPLLIITLSAFRIHLWSGIQRVRQLQSELHPGSFSELLWYEKSIMWDQGRYKLFKGGFMIFNGKPALNGIYNHQKNAIDFTRTSWWVSS